jgi:hypothetical protein
MRNLCKEIRLASQRPLGYQTVMTSTRAISRSFPASFADASARALSSLLLLSGDRRVG